jgi:hypothetical protein
MIGEPDVAGSNGSESTSSAHYVCQLILSLLWNQMDG